MCIRDRMGTSPEDGTSNHNDDDDDDDDGGGDDDDDDDEKESTFNILSITFSENDSLQKRFSMKFSDKLKIQKSDVIYLDMFDSKILNSFSTDKPSTPFPIVNYEGDIWFDEFRKKSILYQSPSYSKNNNNNTVNDENEEYSLNTYLIDNLTDSRHYYDGFFLFSIHTKNTILSNACNLMIKVASQPYFKFTDNTTSCLLYTSRCV